MASGGLLWRATSLRPADRLLGWSARPVGPAAAQPLCPGRCCGDGGVAEPGIHILWGNLSLAIFRRFAVLFR